MKLIDQHTKKIMEECKVRARDAGLRFDNESLEYIVSNYDMLELQPKGMIPTLYDYWVNDVETLQEQGKYKLYPHNPYETVINSRPAISFYNDNNPDWMNIMIFYHVLGHIDFFQNNLLYENTWKDDFVGKALAEKRLIASLRTEHGRWLDYVVEFSRSIDNIVGYFDELAIGLHPDLQQKPDKLSYYFDEFLQNELRVNHSDIYKEISRFNALFQQNPDVAESIFFSDVKTKHPEFETKFNKFNRREHNRYTDLLGYIRDNSPFLKKEENSWMKSVINIVRDTALYFGPQIRTKTINEGWASYWHDSLFMTDERIAGHEVDYAVVNSKVTSISRIGLNPYAIGLRLIQYVEELADKGKINFQFQKIRNSETRENYDKQTGKGREAIFELRKKFSDFMLINTFVDQEFVDMHDLFVVGKRMNTKRNTIEYYVKSRKAEDYKQMLINSQYHPPYIHVDELNSNDSGIYLVHKFEEEQLFRNYIPDTLLAVNFLWSGNDPRAKVHLETTEVIRKMPQTENEKAQIEHRRVVYTYQDKKITKKNL